MTIWSARTVHARNPCRIKLRRGRVATPHFSRERPRQTRLGLLAIGLVIAVLGCASTVEPSAADRSPDVPPLPTDAGLSVADLEAARTFRTTFGLRADDDWIRAVARDAGADRRTFGVPLLPSELEAVIAQNLGAKDAAAIVNRYGAAVGDDWAGMYIDQQAGGTIVVRFKANVAAHERALLALLPVDTKIDVRRAAWTERELRAFMAQVEAERDWFPTIGTSLMTVEIAGFDNIVDVRFDGHDPGAAQAIESHFGDPPWLRAVWNGPGDWTGPRGDLLVVTVDSAGRPVPDVSVFFEPQDIRVPGDGDLGWTTGSDGRLMRSNLPAVTYRLRAVDKIDEVLTTLGEVRVTVPPDGRTSVRLLVRRP